MKRYLVVIAVASAIALAIIVGIILTRKPEHSKTLRIGVILPLTGQAGYLGNAVKNGMYLAMSDAQAQLGQDSITVSVQYEDSGDQVKNAVSAYNKLTTLDNCQVIICVSGGWKALIPLADRDKKVLFCTAVSPSKVASESPWAFRFFTSADLDASLMARFAAQHLKLGRVAIVHVNDEFGNSYKDVFTSTFATEGGQVAIAEAFGPSETNFRPVMTRVKAGTPEAVYLIGYGSTVALAARQMRELGITVPLLSIGTISQPDIMKQAGDAVEGACYTTTKFNTFAPATPQLKRFVETYQAKYSQPPIFFEVFGYDSLKIISTAAQHNGASPEEIRKGLLEMKDYQGAAGQIVFSKNGEAVFPVVVRQVKNRMLTDIDWHSN